MQREGNRWRKVLGEVGRDGIKDPDERVRPEKE